MIVVDHDGRLRPLVTLWDHCQRCTVAAKPGKQYPAAYFGWARTLTDLEQWVARVYGPVDIRDVIRLRP